METKIETEAVPDWLQWVVSQRENTFPDQQEPKKASRTKKSPSETSAVQPSWVISEELTPKNTWVKSKKKQSKLKQNHKNCGMMVWIFQIGYKLQQKKKTPTKKQITKTKTDDFWTLDSEDNSPDAMDQNKTLRGFIFLLIYKK